MEAFPIESNGIEPDLEHDPALGLSQRRKFEILGAILLGLFLGALDQTVVGTALPRIVTDLGGNELYTWVVTIYLLTSTITVPFYGKLSDLFGRKPFLLGGITLFLIGSALSGLSQNMAELILFRGIQGVGAGALFPISLAVIGDLFTPAERGKYQGLFGAVFGVSFIVGPALGGFLTDNVSWHWVFYVNIPIGLISLFVISRLLPNVKNPNATRSLDYLGGLIFTVAIGFLLVGLTNKQTGDWLDATVGGFIAIAVVLVAAFLFVESRAKEPIVPLDLWRGRVYSASMLSTFFVSFAFFGAIIFLPRWFQVVRHESATNSGYLLFPLLIGLIGSSIVSGFIVARTGRYKAVIVTGLALTAVGMTLMTQLSSTTDYPPLWAWMFVTGIGIGPTLAVFTIAVQNAVPFSKLGVATSNLTFFRQIGGSVGLAISGTVFATALTSVEQGLPMKRALLIGIFAAAGILACRRAQSQSALSHDARLPAKFGMLSNVVELSNGGVVFADTKSKLFLRGNLASGKVDTLGSRVDSVGQSSPAGLYKFPGWVAHLAGDTIALVDFSAVRTTLWSEAGKPLDVLPAHTGAGKTPILLYDTLGRGYKIDYQAVLGGGEPGRAIRPDSIPVLRVTLRSGSIDTVANLASPEYGDAVFGEQVQQAAKVFAPNDFFGVLPDGSAWVARGREGRVDWRSPKGEWLQGPPHQFPRLPVTEADKERVLAQVREQGKEFGMPQDLPIKYPFAETKAAFDFALGRPNGEVWLQQPRNDDGAALVYSVFDRRGRWQRDVTLPKDASLAGFGANGAVYASIRNTDGSRSVARFTLK